jgi:hypothetical protein
MYISIDVWELPLVAIHGLFFVGGFDVFGAQVYAGAQAIRSPRPGGSGRPHRNSTSAQARIVEDGN